MEGRYAIVLGAGLGLPPYCYLAAASLGVVTLSLLLPILLDGANQLADRLARSNIPFFSKLARFYIAYREKASMRTRRLVSRFGFLGLVLFIAIPLPATGIWTGAIGAFILGVDKRRMTLGLLVGGLTSVALIYAHLRLLG